MLVPVLFLASPGRADEKRPSKSSAAANEAAAEHLADRAFEKHGAGDYSGAIDLYLKSFAVSGDARVLYNVASIYDKKLHDRKLAEEYYNYYLKSSSTEPDLVAKVNARLVELENEAKAPKVEPKKPEPPKPEKASTASDEGSSAPWKPLGLGIAGLGLVGVGVGAGFGILAMSRSSDLKDQCPNDVCARSDGPALRDDAASAATMSTVFVASGLVLVAGGVTMFLLAPSKKESARALRLQPALGARSGVVLSGRF